MILARRISRLAAVGTVAALIGCDQSRPTAAPGGAPAAPSYLYDHDLPPGDPAPTTDSLLVNVSGPLSVSGDLPMPYPAQYTASASNARTSQVEFLWFTSVCNLDTMSDCSETLWATSPDARGIGMTTFTYEITPDVRQLRVQVQVRELSNPNYRTGSKMFRTKGPRFWDYFVSQGIECVSGGFPFSEWTWTANGLEVKYYRHNRCTGAKQSANP